jgi:hypothetical protein
MAETTCCLGGIGKPMEQWEKASGLPELENKKEENKRARVSLTTTFMVEKRKEVKGNIDPSEYYKLFSKFCYQGDRKGLPHELGIGLSCFHCGLNFKRNPNLPYTTFAARTKDEEKKLKEEIEKLKQDDKMHIESQGVIINDDTFEDLLTTVHLKARVERDQLPKIPDIQQTFQTLIELNRNPIDNYEVILMGVLRNLNEIGGSPTDIQILTAAEELYASIQAAEQDITARVGKEIVAYLRSLTKKTPRECGEALMAYLLVPYQRWLSNMSTESFKILDTYELGDQVKEDILMRGMGPHIQIIGNGEKLTGTLRAKVKDFIGEMSLYCRQVFPKLRTMLTPGGPLLLEYLLLAYVMGPIQKLLNPGYIPEGEEEGGTMNIKILYKSFGQALTKYARGSRVPSEEEIQIALERRAEAERLKFATKQDKMTKEEKQADLMNKKLGLGDYNVGGSRAIREHSDERYADEAMEMQMIGYERYGQQTAQTYDMFGLVTDRGHQEDGYDHDQMREDDY